ncbi:MAG: undecaprenyl-diphosphate phosphatase [Alphaproteobacteria bacterium]|nr:undecaprenyl-diphosphate phosphatase [Alphaproteobacteria bacterium]
MDATLFAEAVLLGVVEGLTEFIPVSSTGHLILLVDLLGFRGAPGKVFEVVIQLGAILAICLLYIARLWGVAAGLARDPAARRFVANILAAFLPAAALGALAHGYIKSVLFSPYVVCTALITGGVLILILERFRPKPRHGQVEAIPLATALRIGLLQCLALVPGVSRSGATIMGAVWLGVERRAAAEFSFFLAIPTMLGAAVFDLYKSRALLAADGLLLIAVGFAAAFVSALVVVRWLVGYVSRRGFAPFGWYRIALGLAMLAILGLR